MQPCWIIIISLLILWMSAGFGVCANGIISVTTKNLEFTKTSDLTCQPKNHNGTECPGHFLCPNNHSCDETENCTCMEGYKTFDGGSTCESIKICTYGAKICGTHTQCNKTKGGFYCLCDKGYHKDGETKFCPTYNKTMDVCTDIDECITTPSICGPNSVCENTYGTYNCKCEKGYRNISNKCEVRCNISTEQEPCTDKPFLCWLKNFTNTFTPKCDSDISKRNNSLKSVLDKLDVMLSRFSYTSDGERLQNVGKLLWTVETIVKNLALLEQGNKTRYFNKKKSIIINTVRSTLKTGELLLRATNSSISSNSSKNADNALLGCLEYSDIHNLMKGAKLLHTNYPENQKFQIVSPVVSVFLGNSEVTLDQPIFLQMNFTREVKVNTSRAHCVFWSTKDSAWSTDGCTKAEIYDNGIQCRCTHLTSFAILMALNHFESWTLTLITKIGLSLSILCLTLAIITFCFCRHLRGTRNTIHTHLCITLFVANCIFLLGIEATGNRVLCGIVAGLLHAFYLSTFCWMALEGLELYLMLVKVFNTHLKTRYLLLVGYGVPAVIIIISASVNHAGYGTDKYCWLSLEKNFIWSFMGPVCAIILVTCGIFVLTVWKLAEKMASINPEQGKLKRIRTLTVTAVAQLCILGCCWIFGFFMFGNSTMTFAYIFTILNTLQGVQIFLLHCLMHKKVREEYWRWICAITNKKPTTYSEFSNTNTQSKGKTSKESGL